MQNFFLSTDLGRAANGAGNSAKHRLLSIGIPAAREAGIRVVWLNWGLTDKDLQSMPPSTRRAFGFEESLKRDLKLKQARRDGLSLDQAAAEQVPGDPSFSVDESELTENGKPKRIYKGLGSDVGPVKLENGSAIDGGRLLFRDTWNASLPPDLDKAYRDGQESRPPDVWIHKNRMSGLWGASTPCTEFLEKEVIATLLFAGVNTDQCVGGCLQDAFNKGFDCILLKDACGTTSPEYATQCVEWNTARTWGFVKPRSAWYVGSQNQTTIFAWENSHVKCGEPGANKIFIH